MNSMEETLSPQNDLLLFKTRRRKRSYNGLRHRMQWSGPNVVTNSGPSQDDLYRMLHTSSRGTHSSFRCDKSHRSDASLASSMTSCSSDDETEHSGPDEDLYSGICETQGYYSRTRRKLAGFPIPLLICSVLSICLFLSQICSTTNDSAELVSPPPPALPLRTLEAPHDVDALVFVALGPKAISPAFTLSVNSAVEVGGWDGPVYVVTDDTEAAQKVFDENEERNGLQPDNLHIVQPIESSDLHVALQAAADEVTFKARLTKCQLLRILPDDLKHVLYIDADVMIGKPLRSLLRELSVLWNDQDQRMEMALFPDCKAFTAGFCLDCDTWNTGVMSLRRNSSDSCMDKWCEELVADGAGSDQAALDRVISQGFCQDIRSMDHRSHLRMMKDVFVLVGLVPEKTFNHFTQLLRPHKLALVYQWFYSRMLGRNVHELVPPSAGIQRSYFAK